MNMALPKAGDSKKESKEEWEMAEGMDVEDIENIPPQKTPLRIIKVIQRKEYTKK